MKQRKYEEAFQLLKTINVKKIVILKIAFSLIASSGFLGASIAVNLTGMNEIFETFTESSTQLKMMDLTYKLKLNQMSLGFQLYQEDPIFTDFIDDSDDVDAYNYVLEILQDEIDRRVIEFATIVDSNADIIASANNDRRGEHFDPEGIVSFVLNNSVVLKTTVLLSNADFLAEGAPELS